jgi:octaprenyl-diphosphate synthase
VRITVAAVGELLHTATLLHDDVVDDGAFRRGRPAARVVHGNGLAVLTGDYCLAKALQAIARTGHLRAVRTLADTVTRMAEGEVAQLSYAGDFSLDQRRYRTVIDRKTAALIAWCSAVAGLVDDTLVEPLTRYGRELGFAFQIADDLLDAGEDEGCSLVRVLGVDGARARAESLLGTALAALSDFGERAEPLRQLLRFAVARDR